jgi:hypothetical protein
VAGSARRGLLITATLTRAIPRWVSPTLDAAALDRSMMRPGTPGPRSLIFTTTDRPFFRFVTRTWLPNGSVRCAAVNSLSSKGSPLAVRRCRGWHLYQLATPYCTRYRDRVRADPRACNAYVLVAAVQITRKLSMECRMGSHNSSSCPPSTIASLLSVKTTPVVLLRELKGWNSQVSA